MTWLESHTPHRSPAILAIARSAKDVGAMGAVCEFGQSNPMPSAPRFASLKEEPA